MALEFGAVVAVEGNQLGVPFLDEVRAGTHRCPGGFELVRREALRSELPHQGVHSIDKPIDAFHAGEHTAGLASQQVSEQRSPREVTAHRVAGRSQGVWQLVERANGGIEPAGNVVRRGQRYEVVAQRGMAQGKQIGRGGKRIGRCCGPQLEEAVSGRRKKSMRIATSDDGELSHAMQEV
jgi:hypothetical protein